MIQDGENVLVDEEQGEEDDEEDSSEDSKKAKPKEEFMLHYEKLCRGESSKVWMGDSRASFSSHKVIGNAANLIYFTYQKCCH